MRRASFQIGQVPAFDLGAWLLQALIGVGSRRRLGIVAHPPLLHSHSGNPMMFHRRRVHRMLTAIKERWRRCNVPWKLCSSGRVVLCSSR